MNLAWVQPARNRAFFMMLIAVSLLLSVWMGYRETVINPDAICYLLSAEAIETTGLQGAMHLCDQAKWPFYSLLIYGLAHTTHLSYLVSAYALNAIFSAVTVLTFGLIIQSLGGTRRTLWLAAAVILLAHEFNTIRQYIVRDHGFWACYLLSIYCLMRFIQTPKWSYALAWNASMLGATLFRLEGLIFLCTIPTFLWFYSTFSLKQRSDYFCMLHALTGLILFTILTWLVIHPQTTPDQFGRLADVINQFQHGAIILAGRYQQMKYTLVQYVLPYLSGTEASVLLLLMMLSWYGLLVVTNLSWGYALLVAYAWISSRLHPNKLSFVLKAYLIMNIIITLLFLSENLFLSKRYLVALSLILMCWVPFAWQNLLTRWREPRMRFALSFIMLLISMSAIGGIIDFGYSKRYVRTAGDWLAVNVPAQAKLYANDYQLMYYSQHFGLDIFATAKNYVQANAMANNQWRQYDYLALRLDKKSNPIMTSLLHEIHANPVQVFRNKRGDQVAIYRVSREEKTS